MSLTIGHDIFKTILQKCINIPNHISFLGSQGGGERVLRPRPLNQFGGATDLSTPHPEDAPDLEPWDYAAFYQKK